VGEPVIASQTTASWTGPLAPGASALFLRVRVEP
jgi:hypothetical protein